MISYSDYCVIRDSKGLKDSDVAKAAMIPASTFSDWKKGKSKPKEEKAKKIAKALGVTYAYLMGWEPVSDPATMAMEQIIQTNDENGGQSKLVQYLYDKEVKKPAATPYVVTDEEFNLILQYRNADEKVKDMIVQLLAYAVSKED